MEFWQLILIAIIIFLITNFLLKTVKFIFKIIITIILAGILYFVIR